MSRPKTSVDRLSNLRNSFVGNKSKVFTCKQVEETVGASYWRACVKDLKDEGLNIVAVRDGRNVVGYKLMDGASSSGNPAVKKAASKPSPVKAKAKGAKGGTAKKAPKVKAVVEKASKVKAPVKAVKSVKKAQQKAKVDVASVVDEMDTGDEYDAEVQAILDAAGLGAK